jgi:hypothetical protein
VEHAALLEERMGAGEVLDLSNRSMPKLSPAPPAHQMRNPRGETLSESTFRLLSRWSAWLITCLVLAEFDYVLAIRNPQFGIPPGLALEDVARGNTYLLQVWCGRELAATWPGKSAKGGSCWRHSLPGAPDKPAWSDG